MNKAQEFLAKHGQTAAEVNTKETLAAFISEMKNGLEGKPSSIPMIPTYLQNIGAEKICPDKHMLLIDAGGTNFRSADGYFDKQGKVHIDELRKTQMPAIDRQLTKAEFYSQIAENVRYLADKTGNVGFCFSYNVAMDKDIDGKVVVFSKEVKAPEVIGTRVGAETLAAMRAYSDKPRKIAILNDTVATLLGGMATYPQGYSTYVGYIYGTGTNACYMEDTANITKVVGLDAGHMLINTECGGFDKLARGDYDELAANETARPEVQRLEKMTSGRYLADVIYHCFAGAANEGLFSGEFKPERFELKDVSMFLGGEDLGGMFASEADKTIARDICAELVDRAAKIGAIMNSAMSIASCHDKTRPVGIVCEGTTFNKLSGYRAAFEKYLHEILDEKGIKFEILQGNELNLVGTLMATQIL